MSSVRFCDAERHVKIENTQRNRRERGPGSLLPERSRAKS